MELTDAITQRHSIRLFTGAAVEREQLEELVKAAALAPSALNSQPWRLHVATGAARNEVAHVMSMTTAYLEDYMRTIGPEGAARIEEFFRNMGDAPVIIALSLPVTEAAGLPRLNDLLSTGAAIENLLLRATDLGLGVCSLTFSFWMRDELASVYELSADREIVALVLVGTAAEKPVAPAHDINVATWHE